jgi:deazaflavin-dependent oxidoreductase (nitroreductase family)
MVTSIAPRADERPTRRIPRWVYAMPEWLFRLRLGGLVPWWVMLVTIGRRSGQPRRVVLDVVRREGDRIWVVAADGKRADWVRNLMADPHLEVWHRWRRHRAEARLLDEREADEMIVELYRRRPTYVRAVYRLLGERVESEEDARRLAAGLQPVELTLSG